MANKFFHKKIECSPRKSEAFVIQISKVAKKHLIKVGIGAENISLNILT